MASSRGQNRYSPYQKPERPKAPEPTDKPLCVDEVEQEVPRTWQTGMPRCPVHPQYAMTEREINTKNGPANLHHCPHEECVISCFGTKEQLDEYLYHVERSLHFTFRNVHCPLVCFCGNLLGLPLSKSEKNKDRLFLTCRTRDCNMFQWGDEAPRKKVKDHWEWWMSH